MTSATRLGGRLDHRLRYPLPDAALRPIAEIASIKRLVVSARERLFTAIFNLNSGETKMFKKNAIFSLVSTTARLLLPLTQAEAGTELGVMTCKKIPGSEKNC